MDIKDFPQHLIKAIELGNKIYHFSNGKAEVVERFGGFISKSPLELEDNHHYEKEWQMAMEH